MNIQLYDDIPEEYTVLKNHIEIKLNLLSTHENKPYACLTLPMKCYHFFNISSTKYISIETNEFNYMKELKLKLTRKKFFHLFGTGNANDIIKAFFLQEKFSDYNFEKYYLQSEQFSLIVNRNQNFIPTKILRIDLFRDLKINNKGQYDFTGGLFHTLKHFCNEGLPLSTGNEKKEINYIDEILLIATVGLFENKLIQSKKENNFKTTFDYKKMGKFTASYFYEKVSGIYFLNTIFPCNQNCC